MERGAMPLFFLLYLLFIVGFMALFAVIWWRIFANAGYSGAMGLLMLIPVVNLAMLLILAFGEWPVHRKIRAMSHALRKLKKQLRQSAS